MKEEMEMFYDFDARAFEHFVMFHDMTFKDFYEITGVPQSAIYKAKKEGKIAKKYADKIADHFDIKEVFSSTSCRRVTKYICYYSNDSCISIEKCTDYAWRWKMNENVLYNSYAGGYRCDIVADNILDASRKFTELLFDEMSKRKE